MAPTDNENSQIFHRITSNWNIIAEFVIWGSYIIFAIVSPPVSNALICAPSNPNCVTSFEVWTKYTLAFVVVFAIIPTWYFSKRRHLVIWIVLTCIVFAGAYYLNIHYYQIQEDWICEMGKKESPILRLKGETLTKDAELKKETPRCKGQSGDKKASCALLNCFEQDPNQVWVRDEIELRRIYLTATYFATVSTFLVGIIFLSQLLFCALQKDDRKKFQGEWIENDPEVPDRPLTLRIIIADGYISGHLLNFSEIDKSDIQDAGFKKDLLTFCFGRSKIKFVMSAIDSNQALLLQKEVESPRNWRLKKMPNSED